MKYTRREVAAALSASAALLAQTPNPPLPANAADELKAAQDALRQTQQQLDKYELPMSVEPAVHFKA